MLECHDGGLSDEFDNMPGLQQLLFESMAREGGSRGKTRAELRPVFKLDKLVSSFQSFQGAGSSASVSRFQSFQGAVLLLFPISRVSRRQFCFCFQFSRVSRGRFCFHGGNGTAFQNRFRAVFLGLRAWKSCFSLFGFKGTIPM